MLDVVGDEFKVEWGEQRREDIRVIAELRDKVSVDVAALHEPNPEWFRHGHS